MCETTLLTHIRHKISNFFLLLFSEKTQSSTHETKQYLQTSKNAQYFLEGTLYFEEKLPKLLERFYTLNMTQLKNLSFIAEKVLFFIKKMKNCNFCCFFHVFYFDQRNFIFKNEIALYNPSARGKYLARTCAPYIENLQSKFCNFQKKSKILIFLSSTKIQAKILSTWRAPVRQIFQEFIRII